MLNSDATEAALGLLGLHSDTQTIPLKRKLSSHPSSAQPAPAPAPLPTTTTTTTTTDTEDISCICGFTYDDGFSIACDVCSRWCHAACFGIVEGGDVPEEWRCWVCGGGTIPDEERERAVKIQRKRLRAMRMRNNGTGSATGTNAVNDKPGSRRKTSPGAEKKPRRASAMSIGSDGNAKRRRRTSMLASASSPSTSTQPQPSASRISQPSTSTSRAADIFPPDVYPDPSTHAHLLKVAKAWRGVTALNPPVPVPRTYIDNGFIRVDGQGYTDQYGHTMSPLDSTTPVLVDADAGVKLPWTVLKHDSTSSGGGDTLRPPSPRLHVGPSTSRSTFPPSPPIPTPTPPPISISTSTSASTSTHTPTPAHPYTHATAQTHRIPSNTLLAPYTATIRPSSAYLADPLNGYAHLGMGKPQVRLVGGGWCVGVDARELGAGVAVPGDSRSFRAKGKGKEKAEGGEEGAQMNGVNGIEQDAEAGKARWARCGCWPNAVVRPVICRGARKRKKKGEGGGGHGIGKGKRHREGCVESTTATEDVDEPPPSSTDESDSHSHFHTDTDSDSGAGTDADADPDTDETTLSFALFALRDLRADEEIVLGWEWDDGHAVHMLPALMESPGMFGAAHLHHLRAQFTSILHALSSTFTTCACGSSSRDCAVKVMERVVDGRWPWPGGRTSRSRSRGRRSESRSRNAATNGNGASMYASGSGSCGEGALSSGEAEAEGSEIDPDGTESEEEGVGMYVQGGRTSSVRSRSKSKSTTNVRSNSILKNGETHAANGEDDGTSRRPRVIDLGPLVGVQRGFRTREREPMSGGWCGVEVVPSSLAWPGSDVDVDIDIEGDAHVDIGGAVKTKGKKRRARTREKGKAHATDVDVAGNHADDSLNSGSEPTLPPRMRKLWSHPHQPSSESMPEGEIPATIACDGNGMSGHETEFDTETEGEDTADDTRQMPPPPMPASLDPTTVSSLAHAHAYIRRSASPLTSAAPGAKSRDVNGNGNGKRTQSPRVPPRWSPAWGISPPPPPTPASTSTSTSTPTTEISGGISSPQPFLASHVSSPSPPIQSTLSPSVPFSKLSLLSPDMLAGLAVSGSNASVDLPLTTNPAPQRRASPLRCTGETSHSDVKRAPNAEPYRVRFMSPEVLGRVSALTGETADVNGVYTEIVNGVGLGIKEESEAMDVDVDVDVDVVGDTSDGTPAPACSPDHQPVECLDASPEDTCPTTTTTTGIELTPSPRPMPSELSASETNILPPHTPTPPQPEPEREPSQPARMPSPQPVPKVKMSLRDFALRRKKQREEELAAAKGVVSPVGLESVVLPPSPNGDDKGADVDMGDDTNGVAGDVPVDCDDAADSSRLRLEEHEVPKEDAIRPLTPPRIADECHVTQTQTKGRPDVDETLTAKLEIMDEVLLNGTFVDEHMPDINHVNGSPSLTSMSTSSGSDSRSTSVSSTPYPRMHSTPDSITSRRPAHEDGEILNSSPPKTCAPRSHTPPTQPRSFQAPRPPSPSFSPGPSSTSSTSRRPPPPPPPPPSRSASGPNPITSNGLSRPVPSGPRALRGTMSQPSYTTYPPPPARPYSGSQYIPRGPSADRDRMDWDRDRDRSWSASSRSRGRAGSGGWGR